MMILSMKRNHQQLMEKILKIIKKIQIYDAVLDSPYDKWKRNKSIQELLSSLFHHHHNLLKKVIIDICITYYKFQYKLRGSIL